MVVVRFLIASVEQACRLKYAVSGVGTQKFKRRIFGGAFGNLESHRKSGKL
jgi:hypothetical protein